MTLPNEQLIEMIEKALENVSPFPWVARLDAVKSGNRGTWVCQLYDTNISGDTTDFPNQEANVHLIANAPEWLRALLEENKRMKRHQNAIIDEDRGTIQFPGVIEQLIVPKHMDITIEEFFEENMPSWLESLRTELSAKDEVLKQYAQITEEISKHWDAGSLARTILSQYTNRSDTKGAGEDGGSQEA